MPVNPPVFNVLAAIWRPPNAFPAPPDFTYAAQLYFPPKYPVPIVPGDFSVYNPPVYIRMPAGVDVLPHDVIECALGDGWFYVVRFIERVHRGFINEYFVAVCEQHGAGPPPPPGAGRVLMESSGFILMEDGSYVLLE